MKILNREITVSNRFIYYYANFVDRIYGFVLRRDGANLPEEHYVGRLQKAGQISASKRTLSLHQKFHQQGDPLHPHLPQQGRHGTDPDPEEIVLFRYRKRLMLGLCIHNKRGRRIAVRTEDRRSLTIRRNTLIYLTGTRATENPEILSAYAKSIRALARNINLKEIWNLFQDHSEPISIQDLAGLYWTNLIDASRWVALYFHLESTCPYFNSPDAHTCVPLSPEDVKTRRTWLESRRLIGEERQEFLHWLEEENDPFDPESFTRRQQAWLEHIRQYALWGSESEQSSKARDLLASVATGTGNYRQYAIDLLVQKKIWSPDENLDLLRSGFPIKFSDTAQKQAQAIHLEQRLKGRKTLRGHSPFTIHLPGPDAPELAFSLKRKWWTGHELALHIPDVSALVPKDSPLDQAASDRLASLHLPDQNLPLFPSSFEPLCRFEPGETRPALSLIWKLDHNLQIKQFRMVPTAITCQTRLTETAVQQTLQDKKHDLTKPLELLSQLATHLQANRKPAIPIFNLPENRITIENNQILIRQENPSSPAQRILRELAILACTSAGRWCTSQSLPTIYETRDLAPTHDQLVQIPNPIVRRHELHRQTPPSSFRAEPGFHHSLGVISFCPLTAPANRYADLLNQRQILHHIRTGKPLYQTSGLNPIRFRAQEEYPQLDGLRRRREYHTVLKHLSEMPDRVLSATVLHVRRDGAIVELKDLPLKTIVHPPTIATEGGELRLRLAGVDLKRGTARFLVLN
ncbi:MAG: RNB domain-containing ribonuclease [bacterium]|nr:RNB domain-containing ribonuclease [bacterium]